MKRRSAAAALAAFLSAAAPAAAETAGEAAAAFRAGAQGADDPIRAGEILRAALGVPFIRRASVASAGGQIERDSFLGFPAANGRFATFNVVVCGGTPSTCASTIFLRDFQGETTEQISVPINGAPEDASGWSALSADGRYVVFDSFADNLVPEDDNGEEDVFLRDRALGIAERVSVAGDGAQAQGGPSGLPALSADGRLAAFASEATNLVPADANGKTDVFVRDRLLGTTERVSVAEGGAEAHGYSSSPALSADGRFAAFVSDAPDLVPGDQNAAHDVFVRDRLLGTTERVSVASDGSEAGGLSFPAALSADGRFVAFGSRAPDLVPYDLNGARDVFVRDRSLGTTERVSVSSLGAESDGDSDLSGLSADGRYAAFVSRGTNLVPRDRDGAGAGAPSGLDLFVRDRWTGETAMVGVNALGEQAVLNTLALVPNAMSADGRWIVFESEDPRLVSRDSNGDFDVFLAPNPLPWGLPGY